MAERIITIGRQCGSGGHTIGQLLAQELGLAFYDKEIVELTAAKTKFSPDFIQAHGEYFHSGSLGHIMGYGTRFDRAYRTGSSLTDQLHEAQSEVILEVAAQGPCVIVGRCADYVLEGKYPVMNVFIYSDMPYKVERSIREHGMEPAKAASILTRRDKARAHHYRFYTERKWGDMRNYDICLDSGRLGLERCAALLADIYRRWPSGAAT